MGQDNQPVAWMLPREGDECAVFREPRDFAPPDGPHWVPLYASPPVQAEQAAQQGEPIENPRADDYAMIDHFLRNNLNSDDDYALYSRALDSLVTPQPVSQQGEPVSEWAGESGLMRPVGSEFGAQQGEPSDEALAYIYERNGFDPELSWHRWSAERRFNWTETALVDRAVLALKPAVLEGWRLVPVVPTDEMEQAMADSLGVCVKAHLVWADVLDAAPQHGGA